MAQHFMFVFPLIEALLTGFPDKILKNKRQQDFLVTYECGNDG